MKKYILILAFTIFGISLCKSQLISKNDQVVYAELIAIPITDDYYISWLELLKLDRNILNEKENSFDTPFDEPFGSDFGIKIFKKVDFSQSELLALGGILELFEREENYETNPNKIYTNVLLLVVLSSGESHLLRSKTCGRHFFLTPTTAYKTKTESYNLHSWLNKFLEEGYWFKECE